jgi:hypothetical protein
MHGHGPTVLVDASIVSFDAGLEGALIDVLASDGGVCASPAQTHQTKNHGLKKNDQRRKKKEIEGIV